VIVIGAGLAGLSSAYELTQAGHEVTVLEARTRSGGRVWTLRDSFPEGLYAEAGATNVFDNHEWTMQYVKELGVALDPMVSTGGGAASRPFATVKVWPNPYHEFSSRAPA